MFEFLSNTWNNLWNTPEYEPIFETPESPILPPSNLATNNNTTAPHTLRNRFLFNNQEIENHYRQIEILQYENERIMRQLSLNAPPTTLQLTYPTTSTIDTTLIPSHNTTRNNTYTTNPNRPLHYISPFSSELDADRETIMRAPMNDADANNPWVWGTQAPLNPEGVPLTGVRDMEWFSQSTIPPITSITHLMPQSNTPVTFTAFDAFAPTSTTRSTDTSYRGYSNLPPGGRRNNTDHSQDVFMNIFSDNLRFMDELTQNMPNNQSSRNISIMEFQISPLSFPSSLLSDRPGLSRLLRDSPIIQYEHLENVPVVLTREQVASLPIKKWNANMKYDTCPISVEKFEEGEDVKELPCGHLYRPLYIDKWLLEQRPTCCVCKADVRDYLN